MFNLRRSCTKKTATKSRAEGAACSSPAEGELPAIGFDELRLLPLEAAGVKEYLYQVGLLCEQKGQMVKALSVYDLLRGEDNRGFKDISQRMLQIEQTLAQEDALSPSTQEFSKPDISQRKDVRVLFGRYELTEHISRGERESLYRCRDLQVPRIVTLKTINVRGLHKIEVDKLKELFCTGAREAAALYHPNILRLYDWGVGGHTVYAAMEDFGGRDIAGVLRFKHVFPLGESLHIGCQLAGALDYAHRRGIVHLNIHPQNIVWSGRRRKIKVGGFETSGLSKQGNFTQGLISSSPEYMSPEQISGKRTDLRADIFSLGTILFEMLTAEKAFSGKDMSDLMLKVVREEHLSPRTINSGVPKVVARILDYCLAKDPGNRYQTAGHLAGHIKRVAVKVDQLQGYSKTAE
jgi:serine/threonine-protein kinase